MRKIFYIQQGLSVVCLSLIVGCSSRPKQLVKPPEPIISGDVMRRDSENMARLSEHWNNGKELVQKGMSMVNDGEAQITEGNRMIVEGKKIIQESEDGYKGLRRMVPANVVPR